MAFSKTQRTYHCWNDCQQSGCPGHTATLSYQSVSDALIFTDGKGQTYYGNTVEFEVLLSMLTELSEGSLDIAGKLPKNAE